MSPSGWPPSAVTLSGQQGYLPSPAPGCLSTHPSRHPLTFSEPWQMCSLAISVAMTLRCGCRVFWGQPWMTAARIKRPEAEGAFFSMAKISFRNTSGLTNVPMSSAALIHCKEDREAQSSGNMATVRAPTGTWACPTGLPTCQKAWCTGPVGKHTPSFL